MLLDSVYQGHDFSDSVLEQLLWHYLGKVNWDCCQFHAQYDAGPYRIDAVIIVNNYKIGIEVDGKAYHDKDRDYFRDKHILENCYVDEIIRIPYAALNFYGRATFAALSKWHDIFTMADDGSVLSADDARYQYHLIQDDEYYCEATKEQLIKELSDNSEVYLVNGEGIAYAMSLESWMDRHNVTPITRMIGGRFNGR